MSSLTDRARKLAEEVYRKGIMSLGMNYFCELIIPGIASALQRERDEAQKEVAAIKWAVVQTVGGLVEGRPTNELSYLQRLRQLKHVEEERDVLLEGARKVGESLEARVKELESAIKNGLEAGSLEGNASDEAIESYRNNPLVHRIADTILFAVDKRVARAEAAERAMREALTPSEGTKAAYIGEFSIPVHAFDEDGQDHRWSEMIPWTTIKDIMAKILTRAALQSQGGTSK
jgi:hypothetical protein